MNTINIFLIFLLATAIGCKVNLEDQAIWQSKEEKLHVVATTTMLADMVREVGGTHVEVIQLMDHKVDPHSYVQTQRDTLALQSAQLIFYNGLHLEAKMQKALTHNPEKNKHTVAVGSIVPQSFLLNSEGERDPHIWGNPKLWLKVVDIVEAKLIETDKTKAKFFKENATLYKSKLSALDTWAQSRINLIPKKQRVLVTSHDAFQYFANSYGMEVKGLQGLSSDQEVGINTALTLANFVKEKGIKTIFAETTVNAKGIKSIAQEAGVTVSEIELFSDACGEEGKIETVGEESYDIGTYIGMIKHNVNTIVEALK